MARRRGKEMPRRQRELAHDYSYLTDGRVWLLVRGEDFPAELGIESVRRRLRTWAARSGYSREDGYVLETLVERADPDTGEPYPGEKDGRPLEWGLNVQLRRVGR